MNKYVTQTVTCAIFALLMLPLRADQIVTKDGSTLVGRITLIDQGKVTLETSYAGTLTITQSEVVSFQSEQALAIRLQSGNVMIGQAQSHSDGTIVINNEDGQMRTTVSKVASGWSNASEDPEIARLKQANEALKRKWKYTAEFTAGGTKGNTEQFDLGTKLAALLVSPEDELKFYLKTAQSKSEKVKTEDETVGGVRYTSYFSDRFGWYVREEIERDEFEGIDFRSTSAAGLTAKVWDLENSKLKASSGFAYRYDSFINGTNEQAPALDFGLDHWLKYKELATVDTSISLIPSIENFSDYLLHHDSGVTVPVTKNKIWNLRFGLSNAYNSKPGAGKTELDTTYYSGLLLNWE